jgi:hypothetical protein
VGALRDRSPNISGERWAKSGMPVTRGGGRVPASAEDLYRWLGREAAREPVQIATESADLTSEMNAEFPLFGHRRPLRKKVSGGG